jgi:hypothetical protein
MREGDDKRMKTKEERREYMRKYVNERRANDSEFRKRRNKQSETTYAAH